MDLISKKVAIEEFEDMVTSVSVYGESAEARYATNARIRFIEKLNNIPTVPAVPLDKLCLLLHYIAGSPCYTQQGADMCNQLIGDQCNTEWDDVKCWKQFLTKWMEEKK